MSNKKSQVVVYDMLFATIVVVGLALTMFFMWSHIETRLEEKTSYNDMQAAAFQISDILVKSQGRPLSWENSSNVYAIGLANYDRELSKEKIEAFINMNYRDSKKLLLLPYDYYLTIKTTNNTIIKEGGFSYIGGKKVVNAQRKAIYDGKIVTVELILAK